MRDGRTTITARDLDAARDRVLLGRRETSNALLPEERHAVAVHESGHALIAALCEHAEPVAKATILPAGLALGVTEPLPEAERHLYSQAADALPAVAAVLPAVASVVAAVLPAVASVVAAVLPAVAAAVDAVRDDNGAAHGGNGPASASGCKWHVSFLPRCRLR